MPKYPATCRVHCFDSKATILYYPGDRNDIDPTDFVAKHFQFDDPKIDAIKYTGKDWKLPVTFPAPEPPPKVEPERQPPPIPRGRGRRK